MKTQSNNITLLALTLALAFNSSVMHQARAASWVATGPLNTGRESHTATLLYNGNILVAGGMDRSFNLLSSMEIYDPITGMWRTNAALRTARANHTATLLPDGKVLITGGGGGNYPVLSSAELYDPGRETSTFTSRMTAPRGLHTATLLPSGKVLVAGGILPVAPWSLSSAEVYDPTTGTWTATGALNTRRYYHTATLLPNGKVLVLGGVGDTYVSEAEVYDPATGRWTLVGFMSTPRWGHTTTVLPSGLVLVAGGYDASVYSSLASAELFNPATGRGTTTTPPMNHARISPTATLLPNGKVLVAGGYTSDADPTCELYDPATQRWNLTAAMITPRAGHRAILLPNGEVLVAGGGNSSGFPSGTELYDPKTVAIVTLGNLSRFYDGTAKPVSVATLPHGLAVDVTYNGSPDAPTNVGSYVVIGTIHDPNYRGSATNTLVISRATLSILVQPASQTVTEGANVTFTIAAEGNPELQYQWRHGAANIIGATNSSCALRNVQYDDSGDYSVLVYNGYISTVSSNATLTVNRIPVANPQSISSPEDTPVIITLTGFDPDSDLLNYTLGSAPTNGTLSGTTPNLTYKPSPNYFGPDSFTFKVNDGLVDSAPATISLTILPVNDAPVAQSQSVLLDEEDAAAITLSASDVEGDALNYTLLNQPMHGTLAGTVPNLIYQPVTNYNGPDSFTFKASDTVTDSLPATVSITVRPVNDPPLAVARVFTLFLVSSNDTELKVIATCDNRARVLFDASLSRDVDNDTLSFAWWEQGRTNAFGNTVVTTNLLRVGSHDIALHVNDSTVTVTNTFPLRIISASHAIRLLEDQVVASALSPRVRRPLVAILEGAAKAFDHGHEKPGVHHLKLFQDKTRKSLTSANEALATQWTWIAQQIIDVFETCNEQSAGVCRMEDRGHGRRCLCFDGVPGRPHIIEASTDLVHWQTIGVAVECAPGRFEFEDFAAEKMSRRFYRLQSP